LAILPILCFPDPRLRKVAKPVEAVDERIRTLLADMLETMYDAPGVGLAATQINFHQQVIVVDVSEEKDQPLFLINPKITALSGEESMEEGCLSVPETNEMVTRAAKITVSALNEQGESIELQADGLLAVCIQHEIDHLQGKLFVDYLSGLKRNRIKKRLTKVKKQNKL
jgi:peptide deformylase